MTNLNQLPQNYFSNFGLDRIDNLDIYLTPWSKNDMLKAAQICDFCLLPTGINDIKKIGASSNRLLTSLAMGLPTITDNLESYFPFREFYIELRLSEISKMINNPIVDIVKIELAQKIINDQFSIKRIKNNWFSALSIFK